MTTTPTVPPSASGQAPLGGLDAGDVGSAAHLRPPARLSARRLVLALTLASVVLAAGVAALLNSLLGPSAWAAAAAAALGVLGAALPVVLLGARLARPVPPQAATAPVSPLAASALTRDLFLDLAGREWARSRRYGTGAALLLIQVDRFARLVESHGRPTGDTVLAELLRHTAPTLRGADVITRFAESQVAVFLTPADATGALDVAERIRERAEQLELPMQPQVLRFTVSVGVAHLRPAHLNLQALLDDAEDATIAARQAGGNCVRAAPVEAAHLRAPGNWIGDNRARPN